MKANENPFRSTVIAELRYRIDRKSLLTIAQKALDADKHCCILGPEGTGKTTLLEDLEQELIHMGHETEWIRLNNDSTKAERNEALDRMIVAADSLKVILLDGGEVLTAFHWWKIRRLRRCGMKVIATLHRSRGLMILHRTKPDWSVAMSLLRTLSNKELEDVAAEAFKESRGNMREVFRACYWACARD
jgi:predicted AAA+ superfamily ATPase